MRENKKTPQSNLKLLDKLIDWYIQKYHFDDPIKEVCQIIGLFLEAKKKAHYEIVLPEFPDSGSTSFIDYISDYAFEAHPNLERDEWKYLFTRILSKKYGGEKFYINSDPAAERKQAAKSMTPNELMNKFGISRGYAYKLRSAALKRNT
ncbi:hypothetical protein [Methylotenera sp. L2L1]|uniref:hypothetical protein n=1 Tax=Methylotenera sp. L2L1 TaxID=1502770 RepID=UPI00056D0B6A|nr:hypothetical protein [Methylotenera sp. L2L1]